ncbi:hypothetical protein N0V90_004075 [Kalmusia sp. IMI 367209]|nr:hypothetical protein N0V90_004075 [Kalmusia sp. IMI 367209]
MKQHVVERWSDSKSGPSYTTIDVSVKRPAGRNELRSFSVFTNRRGEPEFKDYSTVWQQSEWRDALQAKDIIQLIPRAYYPGWVNFVRQARIKIEYEAVKIEPSANSLQSFNDEFYSNALNKDTKEIRILKLHPGNLDDPVECSIERMNLGIEDSYDALSYCWGDLTSNVEIGMDASDIGGPKAPFHVSPSVRDFLRRIRNQEQPLTLWIDQICINQSNKDERAQQVNLMADIYSEASIVHIWLGEGDRGVHQALRIVRDIHNFNSRVCLGGEDCKCDGTPHTLPLASVDDIIEKQNSSSYKAMYEIFHEHRRRFFTFEISNYAGGINNEQLSRLMSTVFANPWFGRVWVLQEALRARTARVYSGQEVIPWDELVIVSSWLRSDEFQKQQVHLEPLVMMPLIWNHLRSEPITDTMQAHAHILGRYRQFPILDVFLNGLELKATDPRDKLFSLYSFCQDVDVNKYTCSQIRPSYNKSVARVFADFTRWWIREYQSLSILSTIHGLPGRSWVQTDDIVRETLVWPTWVIGSEGNTKTAQTTLDCRFRFSASKNTKPNLGLLERSRDDNLETLWLQGFAVSEIQEITYLTLDIPYTEKMRPIAKALLAAFERLFDPCNKHLFWKSRGTNKPVDIPRVESDIQWDINGLMDHLSAHWGYAEFRTDPIVAVHPVSLQNVDQTAIRQRTYHIPKCLDPFLLVAKNGMYGLCPWTAQTGDVITILEGASVPYLLRPIQNVNNSPEFELVGECYVLGAMNGEYFEEQIQQGREPHIFALK